MQSIFGALLTAGYAAAVSRRDRGRPERRPDHEQRPGPADEVVLERRGRRRAVPAVRDGRSRPAPRPRSSPAPTGPTWPGSSRSSSAARSSSSCSRRRPTRSACSPSTTPRTRGWRASRPDAAPAHNGVSTEREIGSGGSRRNDPGNDGRGRGPRRSRRRRVLAGIALVLACLSILLTTMAVWTHQVALNTNRFTALVGTVVTDPAVTDPISARISIQVVDALGVQARLEDAPPGRHQAAGGRLDGRRHRADRRAAPGRPPEPTAPGAPSSGRCRSPTPRSCDCCAANPKPWASSTAT